MPDSASLGLLSVQTEANGSAAGSSSKCGKEQAPNQHAPSSKRAEQDLMGENNVAQRTLPR